MPDLDNIEIKYVLTIFRKNSRSYGSASAHTSGIFIVRVSVTWKLLEKNEILRSEPGFVSEM